MKPINTTNRSEFFLVFESSTDGFKWLKKGFTHCSVLMRDSYNWVQLNPSYASLECSILPYDIKENVPALLKNKNLSMKVIRLVMLDIGRHSKHPFVFGVRSCVEMVKYTIGLKNFRAFTPFGLYKALTKMTQKKKFRLGIESVTSII